MATTYSKEFCATVRKTRTGLVEAGVLADMTRGAEWAKGNLPAGKIVRIKRFITIDEILKFQCAKPRKRRAKPSAKKTTKRRPTKRKKPTKPRRKRKTKKK